MNFLFGFVLENITEETTTSSSTSSSHPSERLTEEEEEQKDLQKLTETLKELKDVVHGDSHLSGIIDQLQAVASVVAEKSDIPSTAATTSDKNDQRCSGCTSRNDGSGASPLGSTQASSIDKMTEAFLHLEKISKEGIKCFSRTH